MKRKNIILILILAITIFHNYPLYIFAENNVNTHTFYKTYSINIPDDNYIIISMRSFGPNNYLLLDMTTNEINIYSPYEDKGFLSQRKLTTEESFLILSIFKSEEYMNIPEKNSKIALDATEIEITSIIDKRKKHIHHIIPDNKIIKEIINLYNELNIIENKQPITIRCR
ncbi:MAG: hypothetical protein KAV18_05905 [Candidatus Omnitrophica bacterium]|nr:hypothetical protein [Candidatus Omnitrophota bacterium]